MGWLFRRCSRHCYAVQTVFNLAERLDLPMLYDSTRF
jgi:hypothetical protein